jgi:16S rRNA (guanine1207-N2)-methyltransferase
LEHYFTNNENLKSELITIVYKCDDDEFTFFSDNGVFSKKKIDFGSNLLIKTIINKVNKKNIDILDVGCGYGLIGISLAKKLSSHVLMSDINKRALHLTKKNIVTNKVDGEVIESNAYENITSTYDLIVTNPPIRAGKKQVYNILDNASNHLKNNGELWFVIRKEQGAKSTIEHLKERYQVNIMEKSKGFYIIMAKKA